MNRFVSLLRGINVGGHRKILMKDLQLLYKDLGFLEISTYIQSGNVVFASEAELNIRDTCQNIEQAISDRCGFSVSVIVKTGDELRKIAAENPFLAEADVPISTLSVSFLSDVPAQSDSEMLLAADVFPDRIKIIGSVAYLCLPNGFAKTKLTNVFLEKALKTNATTRNWKTVAALSQAVDAFH